MASALRKRWRVVAVSMLVVIAGVAAYVNVVTPKYSATAQMFVNASTGTVGDSAANAYAGVAAVEQRMSSYTQIVDDYQVLAPVVQKLHLPYSWETLKSKVSASSPTATELLNITATDANAVRATNIANAVATRLAAYIKTIETTANSQSPVTASIANPAFPPSKPSSPKTTLYLIAAALVGAAIGIALAFIRDSIDSSVKSTDDLRERFRVPALAAIPFDRDTAKHPVVVAGMRGPGRGEAFRQLRTNLQFAQIDEQPRSILVTSAVAEEGKTTAACNLAVALSQIGVDVILLDGDLRRPTVAEYMGVERAVGLTSVLMGWTHWSEALQSWGGGDLKLRILAAGPLPPNPSEMLAGEQMDRLMTELEDHCDVVIIDGPPLLPVADSSLLAASASGTVLVVRQGKTKRQQVTRALAALDAVDAHLYGLVLNASRKESGVYAGYDKYYPDSAMPLLRDSAPGQRTVSESGSDGKRRFGRKKGESNDAADEAVPVGGPPTSAT